jgi:adenosine deaminase/aminodeoxyfutalosine deaminase
VLEAPLGLEAFVAELPKAELHLHLEGSVRPQTLRALSSAKGRLEQETEEWIRERARQGYRYRNFGEFLQAFKLVSLLLDTPADYALATTRLVEELARQNVKYAEVTLAAGVVLWKKQLLAAVFEAVSEAASAGQARLGVRVNWIFDAIRHFGADHARKVLRWAKRFRSHGVVALGIGGDEERGPAELFTGVFHEARDSGLHVVAHAGETCGFDSVRKAVELLGAERIGHGLSAARDPEVLALLCDRAIPLEVCLTSNVATGILARREDHPLPKFLEAGLVVTLNSDDPAMFGTSLQEEFVRAAQAFRLSPAVLTHLCANSIGAAFASSDEKLQLFKALPGFKSEI